MYIEYRQQYFIYERKKTLWPSHNILEPNSLVYSPLSSFIFSNWWQLFDTFQRRWELSHYYHDKGDTLSWWPGQMGTSGNLQIVLRYRCSLLSFWWTDLLAQVWKLDLWRVPGNDFNLFSSKCKPSSRLTWSTSMPMNLQRIPLTMLKKASI